MENNEHDNEQASQMVAESPAPVLDIDQGEIREIPIREINVGEFCRR